MIISDQHIPLLVASLAFLLIFLLFLCAMICIHVRYKHAIPRKIASADEDATIQSNMPSLELPGRPESGFMRFLCATGRMANPRKKAGDVGIKLKYLRAGLRGKNIPMAFRGAKVLLAAMLSLVFLIAAAFFFEGTQQKLLLFGVLLFAVVGMSLPDVWLRSKAAKRKDKLTKAFPDALDLLVVCVGAEMGLDAAISRVGRELALNHPELSKELSLLNLELMAGKPRHAALRNFADRTNIEDVNSLVTLMIQTDRFGTSVVQALKVFAGSFRTARLQRAEEVAAKIGTKMMFPLALFIFPSFLVAVIGPAIIQVYRMLLKG